MSSSTSTRGGLGGVELDEPAQRDPRDLGELLGVLGPPRGGTASRDSRGRRSRRRSAASRRPGPSPSRSAPVGEPEPRRLVGTGSSSKRFAQQRRQRSVAHRVAGAIALRSAVEHAARTLTVLCERRHELVDEAGLARPLIADHRHQLRAPESRSRARRPPTASQVIVSADQRASHAHGFGRCGGLTTPRRPGIGGGEVFDPMDWSRRRRWPARGRDAPVDTAIEVTPTAVSRPGRGGGEVFGCIVSKYVENRRRGARVRVLAGCPTVDLGDTPTRSACATRGGLQYFQDQIWPNYVIRTDPATSCAKVAAVTSPAATGSISRDGRLPELVQARAALPQLRHARSQPVPDQATRGHRPARWWRHLREHQRPRRADLLDWFK